MDAARLESIPLFSSLSARQRKELARHADEIEVEAGRVLVGQGRFSYEFFVIEEGRASVERDGAHVADLGPGDFFGEIGLLETERRTATVTAASAMELIVLTRQAFDAMAHDHPDVADVIRTAARERLPG